MENEESGLEKFTDVMETIATGIPAPLRKNFITAIGQLCTAAVDVPVSWLEGKSAEIRATTDARIKILSKEGNNIANSITVPDQYLKKASEKFASKIIKEQINLDDIAYRTAKELSKDRAANSSEKEAEVPPINEDWLNKFEVHARIKSSEEMKIVFSKILSGEIRKPGSFSMRTIEVVSQLDNEAAALFQTFCNITSGMIGVNDYVFDARVVTFDKSAAANSLAHYGLPFASLNILQEYGLIISDYNSYTSYTPVIADKNNHVNTTIRLGNKEYGFIADDYESVDWKLRISGVGLTKAGIELFKIIPIVENEAYVKQYGSYFKSKKLNLVSVRPK